MDSGRLDVLKEVNLIRAGYPHMPKDYPLEKVIGLGEQSFV